MFKGHPKGLYVLALSNMGERFGYYTMLAIFSLFLQDHYGMDETQAAGLYGIFLAGIYFLPLLGGVIADAGFGYGRTILTGLVTMFAGYILLSFAQNNLPLLYISLGVIALGVGFFKGNLAVIVGNLYEKSEKSHLRDAAFNLFYMFINVGAFFAPHLAGYLKRLSLINHGLVYDSALPKIAHDLIGGTATQEQISKIAQYAGSTDITTITAFAQKYIDAISHGYSWGFAAAGLSMIVSLIVFIAFRKFYKESDYLQKHKKNENPENELTPQQTRSRILALVLVFIIVIFFWMAFHQNGSTLTFFAKNYTKLHASKLTFLLFTIPSLLSLFSILLGGIATFGKNVASKNRLIGAIFMVAGVIVIGYRYFTMPINPTIDPELFQAFNPMFVVFLTPVIIAFFTWLRNRQKEPSPPLKIGYGMIITTIGFSIMLIASMGLPSVMQLGGNSITANPLYSGMAVSPYWLISTYFTLTIAELFLSPMGLSFVAKVAPPRLRGTMQAGWLAATACGNYLAGFIGRFYQHWELWQFFTLIMVLSLTSAVIMFSLLKTINKASER